MPGGNYKAKQGYDFEISFSENPAYSFVKWIAVEKDNPTVEITSGVEFENATEPNTKVKILNDTVAIRLIPFSSERIAVSGEPSPRYDPLGVSRDRSISVSFTKNLSEASFIFSPDEVPAGAESRTDSEGNIWSYTYEGQTYLKNVSITNIDDYSIAEHFTKPQVNGRLLTIGVDRTNPIQFNSGEIYKTVKVTLSKDIADSSNIKMNNSKSWNYQITEATDEKATVNLTCETAEGSVYLAGTRDYSLGQKITLSFTEDANYQFVKWDYDSSIIYIADATSANTTGTVLDKTTGNEATQIRAVCAPRLRVLSYSPVNNTANPTVSKNSSISLQFNHNIPASAEALRQLRNISITLGGTSIKTSFREPVVTEDTIVFAADNSNMIDVPAGQKKTVSVNVPADFYYTLEDGTRITYGGTGFSFDYKIDETTLDKAEVTFVSPADSGEFTAASGVNRYSIGQEVPIAFALNTGWKFGGWTVKCGSEEVPESKIKIADRNALSTKMIVYEAIQGVTVTANASQSLVVSGITPSASVNPKDSDIVITFNKTLATDCSNLLSKIRISSDGNSLDSYYATRSLSGNSITIRNTSPISLAKGNTKNISVTVPSDFYYVDNGRTINLEGQSFNFVIDYTTRAKLKVNFKIVNGESSTLAEFSPASAAGVIKHSVDDTSSLSYKEFNIGEDFNLALVMNAGYQFYGWKIVKADGNLVSNEVSFNNSSASSVNTTLTVNTDAEINVMAVCYKRPVISRTSVSPNTTDEVAKNTPVTLTFDHAITSGTESAVDVSYTGSNFVKSVYYETSLSTDCKTVTLTPIKMLPVYNSYEIVTVTVPHNKIYYLASDNRTKITPAEEDFTWSFKVNNTTMTKTEVRFAKTNSSVTTSKFVVDGAELSSGSKQNIYLEQSFNLAYQSANENEFTGWKVETGPSGYTVTPSTYTRSGTITVTKSGKTYFTLVIDSSDPTKAVTRSYDAIGNGSGGYGINISANEEVKPAVTVVRPGDGFHRTDEPIKLTFNKAMDASKLVFAADKISITYGISSMANYFEAPILSEDGKELTIMPKIVALKEYISSMHIASIDLTVSLKTGVSITKDGVSIPLLQNEKSCFTVSYKPEVEQTPPTKISFFATRKECSIAGASSITSADKFVLKQVNNMTKAEIFQNRTKGIVYLYGKYSDLDSGVSSVTVTQRLTNNTTRGIPDVSEETTTVFTKNTSGVEFKNESGGITTFCIPYEITEEDGAILLNVSVADAVGNKAEPTEVFSAIKKSVFYMGEYNGGDGSPYKLYNKCLGIDTSGNYDSDHEYRVDFSTFKNGINDFIFSFEDSQPAIYGSNIYDSDAVCLGFDNLTIQMKYTDKNNNQKIGTFTANGVSYEHHLVLDIDGYLYGRTMELIITDDMGNVGRRTYSFPAETDFLLSLEKQISYRINYINVECPSSYVGAEFSCWAFFRSSGNYATVNQPIFLETLNYYPNIEMRYDKTGWDEGEDSFNLGKTNTLCKSLQSLKEAALPTVTIPSTDKYSIQKGNPDEIKITLNINESSWNTCDKIFIYNTDNIKVEKVQNCLYFAEGTTSITFPYSAMKAHKYDMSFSIYGEKNNLRSSAATINIPKVTPTAYDTVMPTIMFRFDNAEVPDTTTSSMRIASEYSDSVYRGETCRIYIKDDWSGPKRGTFTLPDGTTYNFNSANSYTVAIPFWKLLNEYNTFNCRYEIYDNNDNKAEGVWSPVIKDCFTCSNTTLTISGSPLNSSYFYVGQNSGSWSKYSSFIANNRRSETLPESKFIKATGYYSYGNPESTYNGHIYKPVIHYTGTASSGNYDYIIQNKDNSILVASDAPVFVQTLVTNRPYSECSKWTAKEWEAFHEHKGDQYMAFSSSDHSPQKYTIPVSEISSGNCYCVIVHYANNTTEKTEVKEKK